MAAPQSADQSPVDRFQQMRSLWLPYIEWISIAAVGVKLSDRVQLLCGRLHLYRGGAKPEPTNSVETEHLVAASRLVPCTPEAASKVSDEALGGQLAVGDGLVFDLRGAHVAKQPYPIRPPGFTADVRVPSYRVMGDSVHSTLYSVGGIEVVEWGLRGHNPPYYGLDQLLAALGLPTMAAIGDLARLDVSIAPPVIIQGEQSAIRAGRAEVRLQASPRLATTDISVRTRSFSSARGIGEARALEFVSREPLDTGEHTLVYAGDVGDETLVQVFLAISDLAVNQYWINDATRRLHEHIAIAEVFDESLATLDRYLLSTRGDQSELFEWAIATLATLLGYRILWLGKGTPITDGPDLLAMTAAGNVCVVECTVGHPDNKDKVAKVIQRA